MTLLPLSGIRVLDLGHLLPGPLTAVLLADLGAEVIKIEKPPRGDANRYIPPLQHGISPYFLMLNRNKKSIFLDLKQPKDHRKFLKLVQKSDVLIENFRPGVMKKLALDHEALSKINPKLIYCSISGYGQKGPWKGHAGHDLNYVALSGLLYATAFRGERPVQFATQLGDIVGGSLMPALSILAALLLREKTNQGCWIDSAMMPATMMLWILVLGKILQTGQEAKKDQDRMTGKYPNYTCYVTKDGRSMAVAAIEPKFWKKFCERFGKPAYADWIPTTDAPGFPTKTLASYSDRKLKQMKALIQKEFRKKDFKTWRSLFDPEPEACCTPVLSVLEAAKFLKILNRNDLTAIPSQGGISFPQLLFAFGNPALFRKHHRMPPH